MHLDLDDSVPLARFTASALHIEREPPRPVAAHLRFRQLRQELADVGKNVGVGSRVGARGAADGRLIDVNHLVQMLVPLDVCVPARAILRPVEQLGQLLEQNLHQKRALA